MKVKAIYVDSNGTEYSCYVCKTERDFALATAHGPRPITFYLADTEAPGGYIQFHDYRFEAPHGLRGCDYIQAVNNIRATLLPPQKPALPPIPQAPPDSRIHVEPGGDSFRRLQEGGARAAAEYERNRQHERQQLLNVLNQPDPRKVAEARRTNNEWAARMRPRRPEGNGE